MTNSPPRKFMATQSANRAVERMPAVDVVLSAHHSLNDLPEHRFDETVDHLVKMLPPGWRPTIAIVCGSGLGGLKNRIAPIDSIKKTVEIDYCDIPHFSRTTGISFALWIRRIYNVTDV